MNNAEPALGFLSHGGAVGRQIAEQDWSCHPLGDSALWPAALKSALGMVLGSGFPSYVAWGEQLYTFYNAAYQSALGTRAALGQGRALTELWPDVATPVLAIAEHALAGHPAYFEDMEFQVKRHGHFEAAWFTFSCSPIFDERGVVGGVLGTAIETTDRMQAMARLRETDERHRLSLEASAVDIRARKVVEQQLVDSHHRKDEFLAMLAHELRNPLAPISAAAQLLKIDRLDEQRVRKTSDVIVRQVEHMTSLVNDLLDVSRVTRGLAGMDMSPVEMADVVAEAIEQVAPLIDARRHQLHLDLTPVPTIVAADQKRLVQVLANILTNAAKYTPDGGHITLRTRVQDGWVAIDIVDDGVGMAPELTARVFDLFSQAQVTPDRDSGGLGLGLALVKSLVELHGGTVACSSAGPGQGSTFSIRLARVALAHADHAAAGPAAPGAAPAAAQPAAQSPAGRPLRVMVVDDNEDAAEMIAMLLEAVGYTVWVEHMPSQAIERATAETPDVCLLDIGLPEMDGNQLARRLRSLPGMERAVLVAITGYGQDRDRRNTLEAGFDHHFVKPVDTQALMAILAAVAVAIAID